MALFAVKSPYCNHATLNFYEKLFLKKPDKQLEKAVLEAVLEAL